MLRMQIVPSTHPSVVQIVPTFLPLFCWIDDRLFLELFRLSV